MLFYVSTTTCGGRGNIALYMASTTTYSSSCILLPALLAVRESTTQGRGSLGRFPELKFTINSECEIGVVVEKCFVG